MASTAQPSTRIMLWTLPRSVSTAFEHSVRSLPGVHGFHEPFSAAYYLGEEMRSPRYADMSPVAGTGFRDTVDMLEKAYPDCRALFAKDMAYAIDDDFALIPKDYTHSFLIRDPRLSIPSLYRILESGKSPQWREFLAEEFDYGSVVRLRDYLKDRGHDCPIVDAGDLLAEPDVTMRKYCDAVGLSFDPSMLRWDSSESEDRWAVWGVEWYETLSGSSGFVVKPRGEVPETGNLPTHVQAEIEAALPVYKELYGERI